MKKAILLIGIIPLMCFLITCSEDINKTKVRGGAYYSNTGFDGWFDTTNGANADLVHDFGNVHYSSRLHRDSVIQLYYINGDTIKIFSVDYDSIFELKGKVYKDSIVLCDETGDVVCEHFRKEGNAIIVFNSRPYPPFRYTELIYELYNGEFPPKSWPKGFKTRECERSF